MRILFSIILFSSIAFLSGCKKDVINAELQNKWTLTSIGGEKIDLESFKRKPYITLDLDGKALTGFGGCSKFQADITFNEETGSLKFKRVLSEKNACKHKEVDKRFHQALSNVNAYEIIGDELTLIVKGKEALRLSVNNPDK